MLGPRRRSTSAASRLGGGNALLVLMAFMAMSCNSTSTPPTGTSGTLHFIDVSNSPSSNPVQGPLIKGLQQAGGELSVSVTFRGTKDIDNPSESLALLQDAIATKPDGLIISDSQPQVLNATIQAAVRAGIPVVLNESGFDQVGKVGALTYVGMDEAQASVQAGIRMKAAGAKNALVVTLAPGTVLVADERTDGFIQGFAPGHVVRLAVPIEILTNTTELTKVLSTSLLKDTSIDSVFSIGNIVAPSMLVVRDQLGSRAAQMHFATYDLGTQVLSALQQHQLDFAIDQQKFLQGYLPVLLLTQYIRYQISPAQNYYATGPGFVTPDNAAQIVHLSAGGWR